MKIKFRDSNFNTKAGFLIETDSVSVLLERAVLGVLIFRNGI